MCTRHLGEQEAQRPAPRLLELPDSPLPRAFLPVLWGAVPSLLRGCLLAPRHGWRWVAGPAPGWPEKEPLEPQKEWRAG